MPRQVTAAVMIRAFRLSIAANVVLTAVMGLLVCYIRFDASALKAAPPHATSHGVADARKTSVSTFSPRSPVAESRLTPGLVAQLEQNGISRDVLVSVLLEDLNRRSARRLLDLQKKYAPRLVPDRELRELSRASISEQTSALKGVFGEAGYLAWDKEQTLHTLNRARVPGDELPMSAAETEQAYRLQKDFDEKNLELQMAMEDGVADGADAALLLAQAQQALDRELEKLLGAQRFSELRGNIDPIAQVYRSYGGLNPTSAQASAVIRSEENYRAREAALTQQLNKTPDTAALLAELSGINVERENGLRRIFGAETYDNFKKQSDPVYQTLVQYAGTWNLNGLEVQSVYGDLRSLADQTDRIKQAAEMREAAGQRVNWRELDANVTQAREQTEAVLQNLLGQDRFQRLKQNDGLMRR